jgi:uncharacterized protein (TIGR02118 family)
MIKVVAFLRRNRNVSREEFIHYWKTVHAPLVKEKLPRLKRYVGNFPIGIAAAPGFAQPEYDALIETGFDTVEDMQWALSSASFLTEARLISSARAMDLARTEAMVVEEIVIER